MKRNWESTSLQLWKNKGLDKESLKYLDQAKKIRKENGLNEIKAVIRVICVYMSLPLFLFFWICDLIYAPQYKFEFLGLRLAILPILFVVNWINYKAKTFERAQWNALVVTFANSSIITIMVFMLDNGVSPYYAGLNLVAIGALSFIPWNRRFMWLAIATVYMPYYFGMILFSNFINNYSLIATHSFFIVGTISISVVIKFFNDRIRLNDTISQIKLGNEIEHRNEIIKKKTEEAVALRDLSQQFSPQVVSSIKNGLIDIKSGVHRSKICAIFIDIVNSTERITKIDDVQVDKCISYFMEDTNKILLKHDITIDKFLGDGILAFSNDPIQHDDYVARVVRAAVEIRTRIEERKLMYAEAWESDFEISIGLSLGHANVGFYGSSKYYHSYTAIGPVINLASRLCSAAGPNQILASSGVIEAIDKSEFDYKMHGKIKLKGFDSDNMKLFEVTDAKDTTMQSADVTDCPKCNVIMHIDTDARGIIVFKCRECGYIMKEPDSKKSAA